MNASALSRSDPNPAKRDSLPSGVVVDKLVRLECQITLTSSAYLASLDIIIMADGRQAKRMGQQVCHDPQASESGKKRSSTAGGIAGSVEDYSVDVCL